MLLGISFPQRRCLAPHLPSVITFLNNKQSALKPAFAKVITLAIAGSLALMAVAGCASTSSTRGRTRSVTAITWAVLITGTAHEPPDADRWRTAGGACVLRWRARTVTDGPGGKSSSASVTIADDQLFSVVALTPRRTNGAV